MGETTFMDQVDADGKPVVHLSRDQAMRSKQMPLIIDAYDAGILQCHFRFGCILVGA
ncbi:MAG TPA: hypothetical protein VM260_27375 [Pirellula sp.]|nr:hypothetical protein [Pirellula sp.]